MVLSSQSVSKPTTTTITSNVPIPTNFLPAVLTNDSRRQSRAATVLLTEPDNRNNGQRSITGRLLDGGATLGLWRCPTTKHQSPDQVARSKVARPHALLDGRMASATAFRGTVALLVDSVIPRGGGMEEGYVASIRGSKCSGIRTSKLRLGNTLMPLPAIYRIPDGGRIGFYRYEHR